MSETPRAAARRGPLDHSIRVSILCLLAGTKKLSPVAAAGNLTTPLGTVAYHFRWLFDKGIIKQVGHRQRRGAQEHFYAINTAYDGWPDLVAEAERRLAGVHSLQELVDSIRGLDGISGLPEPLPSGSPDTPESS